MAHPSMVEVVNTDPQYQEFPWNSYREIIMYELANTAVPRPTTPFYAEWEAMAEKAFEDVRNGADPKQTLDRYTEMLERTAAKYR